MFHMDVVKVDQDAAYVAIVVHVCAKVCYQCFICVFQMHVASVLYGCCICFTHTLHVFYLDVAYVLQWF